jgi:predicted amidohydrolase YtcJ
MSGQSSGEVLIVGARVHAAAGGPTAEALLVRDGRVAALGTEAEVRALASPGAREERLDGATVTPGLTDAHVHLTAWALARRRVRLDAAPTLEAALARVAAAAEAGGGGWVLGQGWNANRWGGFPTRQALDRAVPDRPAFLESHDIHAAWLNTAALRRCGITAATADPPGGQIVRDPGTGEPTGILLEAACRLAFEHLPLPGPEEVAAALADAQREAHRLGITGVHSVEPNGLEDFGAMLRAGRLRLRVLQHVQLHQLESAIASGLRSGLEWPPEPAAGERGWIRIGGVKMFLDGALGSRTAWLREPYEGTTDEYGISTLPEPEFREAVRLAAGAGLASTVHAIGDAAVALGLEVLGGVAPPAALPHRLEHVQLCPPELWERVGRSGIVASMQPVHLLTDIPAAERHWGHARSRGAYAFAPLLRAGAVLAFGSDVPVETIDPRPGFFAATRRAPWEAYAGAAPAGAEWYPEHALRPAEVLAAYTEGPARAAGLADRRGRLLPGYDADLVVWDRDPLRCEPEEYREMRCLLTMVAGEVVHRVDG